MVTAVVTNLSQDYLRAFNSHDLEKILSLYADDCTIEDVGSGTVYHGKSEVRNYYTQMFKSYPDINMEFKTDFGSGDWQATEWVSSGTNKGDMPARGNLPEIKATNKRVSIKGATIAQQRGDKVIRQTVYWNMASLMQQLGFMHRLGLSPVMVASGAAAIAAAYFVIVAVLAAVHLV